MPGKKKTSKKEANLLELLQSSLAEEEVRQVFTGALLSLDTVGLDRLMQQLNLETGQTLRQVMASYKGGVSKSKPTPGLAKIRQEWKRAVEDWRDCLHESGDEHGRYSVQENDWEEPYLDVSALNDDLDKIAAKMRPMIPRMVRDDIDPEFGFFDLALETVEEIGAGLPEWMRYGGEEFGFGAEATGCLLEWAWQRSRTHTKEKAFTTIASVRELEFSNGEIYLDGKAVAEFFLELDEEAQREILSGIEENRTSPEWKAALDNVHSGWFSLHKELLKRWSKSRHAEICRENMQKDWKLALPVLEGIIKKRAFDEASIIAEQALHLLLDLSENETWNPTKELLICHPRPHLFYSAEYAIARLFKLWSKTAGSLGRNELSAALDLQSTMVTRWKDWDKVLSQFEKTSSMGFVALVDRFFAQWKHFTAAKTEKYIPGNNWHAEWSWIPILADEARAKRRNSRRFHKSIRNWLGEVGQSPEHMKRARYSLERLTLDLNRGSALLKTSPTLHRILSYGYDGGDLLDQSRKRWLKRLDAQGLFSDVMAVWIKGIVHLVPDPTSSHKSRYYHHAEWLNALYELNHSEYERLVKEWRDIHRRRLNLWKAVSEQGLPVPGKRQVNHESQKNQP